MVAASITPATSATSPLAVLGSSSLTAYWRFQRAVAAAQLRAWLPPRGQVLLDISGPRSSVAAQAAASGYRVIRVLPQQLAATGPRAPRAGTVRGRGSPPVVRSIRSGSASWPTPPWTG